MDIHEPEVGSTSKGQRHVAAKRLGFIVVAVIVVSTLASFALRGHAPPGAMVPVSAKAPPVHVQTAALPAAPAGSTLLATVHRTIPAYTNPKVAPDLSLAPTWHGAASVLPVIWAAPGWVDVRLSQRPNESTAWVRDDDVTLSSTPYRIVVDLGTAHLSLYKNGQLEFSVPAGVGTTADPTPLGQYFVAFLAAPPSSGYGPFVMVSSAHSNTISDWESSGDALMAIHGPLGADSEIGTTGAHVSHGCVRLHIADLQRLREVPAGSPIDVVAS
jgi:lipoprotein-anchoring transpeptidase ErfK/SrfK